MSRAHPLNLANTPCMVFLFPPFSVHQLSRVASKNPLAQFEDEKLEHETKMKKMESEMEQVFEMKVKEKKQKLKDSEADVRFKARTYSNTIMPVFSVG